tara:strand:+ start:877 stop:1191 length:315 start_codon:yes stop_codon:yes gene_type:complete
MGKNKDMQELTNLMTKALRHKIGSIVNKDEFYAGKYAKDAENIMKEAGKVLLRQNWNNYDKIRMKGQLKEKLKKELEQKDFLDNKKFDMMDEEVNKAIKEFDLD